MIRHDEIALIRTSQDRNGFIYPWYGGRSIAEIGPSILSLFGLPAHRPTLVPSIMENPALQAPKKIFLLIDGFGMNHFIKYGPSHPVFKNIIERGTVHALTSVFPSTTSAALTTIHTGITPQEHGLPEWNVYFEEFDSIIQTLPFRAWGMTEADSLLGHGGHPSMLYEGPTVYSRLAEAGIPAYVFASAPYAKSVYSRSSQLGATIIPFTHGLELMAKAAELINTTKGPAYFFLYWGGVDTTAHTYGPDTEAHIHAIAEINELLENHLLPSITPEAREKSVLITTADHGHVNIKREEIINLNRFPELEEQFMVGPNGKKIPPTGSPHDVFLFIKPEKRDEIVSFLQKALEGRAEVMATDQALVEGLFGLNTVSQKFRRRIGNVLILPRTGSHIWYEFFPGEMFMDLGIHGGLSDSEMIVPFAICHCSDLVGRTPPSML